MVGVDLGAAAVAAPEMSAERFRSAVEDVGDGAPVRWQNRPAMRRQVVVRKAAEDVRDLDHDRSLGSEAGHQLVEYAFERGAGRLGQVRVDGGRGDAGVAEQDLHDPGIDAAFQKPRGIAMPQ